MRGLAYQLEGGVTNGGGSEYSDGWVGCKGVLHTRGQVGYNGEAAPTGWGSRENTYDSSEQFKTTSTSPPPLIVPLFSVLVQGFFCPKPWIRYYIKSKSREPLQFGVQAQGRYGMHQHAGRGLGAGRRGKAGTEVT